MLPVSLPCAPPIDMFDHVQYLEVVESVLQSDVPNYRGIRVPVNSTFNLQYLEEMIADYHDQRLIDYSTFAFLLGLIKVACIKKRHASALNFPEAVEEYITTERTNGTLLRPPSSEHI